MCKTNDKKSLYDMVPTEKELLEIKAKPLLEKIELLDAHQREKITKYIDDAIETKMCDLTACMPMEQLFSSLNEIRPCEEIKMFYDAFSGRYFKSTLSRVLKVQYKLNDLLPRALVVFLSMLYEELQIGPPEYLRGYGWDSKKHERISFKIYKTFLADGEECYCINYNEPIVIF